MQTGITHLHTTVVVLFMIGLLIKTVLLLADQFALLDKIRAKTKIVEIIFGVLILVTGSYLLIKAGHPPMWLMIKTALVLVFIPLGIIGLKKHNKILALLSLLGFVYIFAISYTKNLGLAKASLSNLSSAQIYTQNCVRCHGDNGDAMISGAYNLKISRLARAEAVSVILNGRNTMPAYGGQISKPAADSLAAYIEKFRQ